MQFRYLRYFVRELDFLLRILFPLYVPRSIVRDNPSYNVNDCLFLNIKDIKYIIGLIRIDHTGEICAQALYRSQLFFIRNFGIRKKYIKIGIEEIDHLFWCKQRLTELGGSVSKLNLFFYICSFIIGLFISLFGENISLGFISESERQVVNHLKSHLNKIPIQDKKTRIILKKMIKDEYSHYNFAKNYGGMIFPFFLRKVMKYLSKVMIFSSYYI
ncbi:2-polyprenyl-3-methyl-6-methoxy-1,4-benzoquinone monooxygenase [Candidatus Legionella polyplacis]|uniref:2-polyprenyl-3-methyl-6-methoxy-1,4-benzoquinone monooxygenase n=1 Tax=Candidatus Legionella polyplacis TaxID=2005262 RepID=A0ABZ2GWK5_9GAMM